MTRKLFKIGSSPITLDLTISLSLEQWKLWGLEGTREIETLFANKPKN